jgi:heavy metal-binding protein
MAARSIAYLCPDGYYRADNPGRCPEHGMDLQPEKFRCGACGTVSLSAGDCPQCKSPFGNSPR